MAREFEGRLAQDKAWENSSWKWSQGAFNIVTLPRARKVHQPMYTAPWTSLECLLSALKLLSLSPPDIILTNGPGTGVIIAFASLILRFFDLSENKSGKARLVYVESLARCKSLSLSGKLLLRVVDRFLVQWPEMRGVGSRAEFKGTFALDAATQAGMLASGDETDDSEFRSKTMDFAV